MFIKFKGYILAKLFLIKSKCSKETLFNVTEKTSYDICEQLDTIAEIVIYHG